MNDQHKYIVGPAAPIPITNLDTDQIMPKQFLRGIDKSGLKAGLLYDLRFYPNGERREEFILNRPQYSGTKILIGQANFGCGSSREHAVWGLMQYGIKAVIAPSFGEIFYSNAMNNGLMLAIIPQTEANKLMDAAMASDEPLVITIDVENLTVRAAGFSTGFALSRRYQEMFLNGLDMIGTTLSHVEEINAFAKRWQDQYPWLKDVAARAKIRLDR